MPERAQLTSQVTIKVGGTKLQQTTTSLIVEVVIDQHAHLPHMFTIRLHDPDLQLLDTGPFDIAKEVDISASIDEEGNEAFPLIKGEITALEPEFHAGMNAELVVRGYDKSHRLFRETRSKSYLNVKDSDLAEEIAQKIGLKAEVDATSIVYEHIYQHNQSDLAFLMQRAWRIGFECFVDDGSLYFRKPINRGKEVTLTWGQDLLSFHPRMTVAEQVKRVTVRGWDAERQKPIVGQAESGKLYPKIQEPKDGAAWAAAFSGESKLVVVDQPVVSQSEADLLAKARLDELSGAFIEAEGMASRRPDIRAGKTVELLGLGERMSGVYLATQATHRYSHEGLSTTFSVRGTRFGLLTEQLVGRTPLDRYPSVVTGVVTNTEDPKKWGRVKVKYAWMSEDDESDWARVVGVGAGPDAGYFIIPEVDDEVVVAFGYGDFGQPIVIGGLWHGKAAPPPEGIGAASGEKPQVRTWHSRKGHKIIFYDDSANKVQIETAGGLQIVLDDTESSISIKAQRDVTINAGGNLVLKAKGNVDINGTLINLNS
mgnify:CR=1 FL=1